MVCQSHHKLIYALSVRHAAVVQQDTKNAFLNQPAQLYWQTNLFCLQYTATCFGIYAKAVVMLIWHSLVPTADCLISTSLNLD